MDLLGALTSQLDLGETEAKGLAGGLLGLVQKGLEQHAGPEAAAELEAQVPEMGAWQAEGDTPPGEPGVGELLGSLGGLLGGGGSGGEAGGGLLGGLGGALGGLGGLGDALGSAGENAGLVGAIAGLVQRFGLDAGKASVAGGLIAKFLEEKLGDDLLAQARPILALLSGGSGGDGGGLGGMLGGLLG